MKKTLVLLATVLATCSAAHADKVTRTVSSDGVPKISIRGEAARAKAVNTDSTSKAPSADKDFQVYELDGGTGHSSEPQTPVVVVVPSPPPIAPNAGAFWYGYGYPGNWGYPVAPVCPPVGPWGPGNFTNPPVNYQNPPVNYQNRPVNYQNPPVNYQSRSLTTQRPQPRPWRR